MKIVLLITILTVMLWAESAALFARVINVPKNDTLNIRSQAHYKAKKIGEIPSGFKVGVERCERVGSSAWCEVYALTQIWSEHFSGDDKGWVNEGYLKFYNKGYVLVDGKGNCDYVIGCENGKCELVIDFEQNSEGEVVSLKTKWIARKRLKGESSFTAMKADQDGYCNIGMFVNNYLKRDKNSEKF